MGESQGRIESVARRLGAAGCIAPESEAHELVRTAPDLRMLERWVRRREQGEPLAWITGQTTFCGRTLRIVKGVYVPRWQSEELAHRAVALLPNFGRAVDLCTGSGAIAAHLRSQVPTATVVGTDIDALAARCARINGVPTVLTDIARGLRSFGSVDLVTAVAPYVPGSQLRFLPVDVQRYEPAAALDGGADGLGLVRQVIRAARMLLRPGGSLLVELGGQQHIGLASALEANGFERFMPWWDEEGDLRGLQCCAGPAGPNQPSGRFT